MNINVIQIGNSRGIRIPKSILDRCQIDTILELSVENEKIILSPVKEKPREGWEKDAMRMRKSGDDALLIPDAFDDDPELAW